MRPSTAVSADGPLNLFNAVGVAVDPNSRGRGVLVVMNDSIHAAHSLTKTSTTSVETFLSPVRGLVGVASYGKNDFYFKPEWKHTTQSEFDISQVTQMPRVDIIYGYVDMPGDLIDAAVADGARGIVIAGVGNGNMTKAAVTAAANAVKKGVVVVRASRVMTGLVGRNVELNDDELGFIASDELNPQKARILLVAGAAEEARPRAVADDVPHVLNPAMPLRPRAHSGNGMGTGPENRHTRIPRNEHVRRSRRQREASDYRRKLAGAGRSGRRTSGPCAATVAAVAGSFRGPLNRRHHGGR